MKSTRIQHCTFFPNRTKFIISILLELVFVYFVLYIIYSHRVSFRIYNGNVFHQPLCHSKLWLNVCGCSTHLHITDRSRRRRRRKKASAEVYMYIALSSCTKAIKQPSTTNTPFSIPKW